MVNIEITNYDKFAEIIERYELSGEQVLQLLTCWNGTQIIDDGFMYNLKNVEGYEEEEEED